MYDWKADVETFEPSGSTVEFVKYQKDGVEYFGFDSRQCVPPEPMVNAMIGLKFLTNSNQKLVMVNHKNPAGLLAKISQFYDIEVQDIENGAVKLIFSFVDGKSDKADLSNSSCAG